MREPGVIQRAPRVATHYDAALTDADGGKIDVIVTDIEMPECDGLELCRRLRGDPDLHHVRIVVVSGVAAVEGEAAVAAGCDAVIEKPCRPSVLVETIRLALARRPPGVSP